MKQQNTCGNCRDYCAKYVECGNAFVNAHWPDRADSVNADFPACTYYQTKESPNAQN